MAIPGGGDGSVLAASGGLGDELAVEHGLGAAGVVDGGAATQAAEGSGVSLRSRLAVQQSPLPWRAAHVRVDAEHERRKGNCWDNAPTESFFGSLKAELMQGTAFSSRREAQAAIFEYMEVFYNRQRLHSALGYTTPAEYEEAVSGQGSKAPLPVQSGSVAASGRRLVS